MLNFMSISTSDEVTTPSAVVIDEALTLYGLVRTRAIEEPARTFGEHKDAAGVWQRVTRQEFDNDVRAVAKGLIALRTQPGDTVGLWANTRLEWAVLDMAIQAVGALTVPIYPTSSAHQVQWIHDDAQLALLLVETPAMRAIAQALTSAPPVLEIDAGALDQLRGAGAVVSDAALDAALSHVRVDDVATIVYTSGTTGRPKGVQLTHRNFVQHAIAAVDHPDFGRLADGDTRILLFLPLAHVFARFEFVLSVHIGSVIGFTPRMKTLAEDLRAFQPTWLPAVPRVLETVYNTADATAGSRGKQRIFRWAAEVARTTSVSRQSGARIPRALALQARIADRLVWSKIREAMGGQLKYLVMGGAKLSPRIGHFFSGIGMVVMEGYGATETSAPHTCNPPLTARVGDVGIPFPGCTVRIAADGEILAKGANVFAGYRGMPDATAEVLSDGWFHTGDLGAITPEGHLAITGRKKEILITAGGKNVQPAGLEDIIRPYPLVQEVVVVGDGKPFVSALIAFDEAMLPKWLKSKGLALMSVADAALNPVVRAHLQSIIDEANATVSRAEAIREWRVLPRELTEAYEELSASMKVRRSQVSEHFADVITGIYGAEVA